MALIGDRRLVGGGGGDIKGINIKVSFHIIILLHTINKPSMTSYRWRQVPKVRRNVSDVT